MKKFFLKLILIIFGIFLCSFIINTNYTLGSDEEVGHWGHSPLDEKYYQNYNDYLKYYIYYDNTVGVRGRTDKKFSSVVIPSSIDGYPVTSIDGFECNTDLTTVIIPDSVDTINGFYGCTGLTHITIPDSVIVITYQAFGGCTGLTHITIPDSVKYLGDYAFDACSNLKSVKLPNNEMGYISGSSYNGSGCFRNCISLEKIEIPEKWVEIPTGFCEGCTNLKEIDMSNSNVKNSEGYEFEGCSNLTKVTFSDCLEDLYGTFIGCTSLEEIEFPDSLKYIYSETFKGCTGLSEINLPENLKYIGIDAFAGCLFEEIYIPSKVDEINNSFNDCCNLERINVSTENTRFCSIDGVVYFRINGSIVRYPEGKKDIEYSIPKAISNLVNLQDKIFTVEMHAFYGNQYLQKIELPDAEKVYIEAEAFGNCTMLNSIVLPEKTYSIDGGAFKGCTSLRSIIIPENLKDIDR